MPLRVIHWKHVDRLRQRFCALPAFMNKLLAVLLSLLAVSAFARDVDLANEARQMDRVFADAARESGVPAELLRAIAYVETRWTQRTPGALQGDDAPPPSYGVMGLRDDDWFGHSLVDAAAMIGRTPEELKRA